MQSAPPGQRWLSPLKQASAMGLRRFLSRKASPNRAGDFCIPAPAKYGWRMLDSSLRFETFAKIPESYSWRSRMRILTELELNSLKDLFVNQIQDLYDAEVRIVKALPNMADAAAAPSLKQAFLAHLEQTKEHVGRLK